MTYSVARKADRHAMAKELATLITGCGFKTEIEFETADGYRDRRVDVVIRGMPHGLRLCVDFKPIRGLGAELGSAGVLSWHGVENGWRLAPGVFGSVNSFHGCKATDIAHTFDGLKYLLAKRLERIGKGDAFVPDPRTRQAV